MRLNLYRSSLVCAGLIVCLAAAFVVQPPPLFGQTGTVLRISPDPVSVGEGQIAVVTLLLDNAQGAYRLDVRGSFNPALVEIVPFEASAPLQAGGFIKPDFLVVNKMDNTAGTFQWVAAQVSPSEPANGSGPVVVIQIRGKTRGQAGTLGLTAVELASRTGQVLPVTLRGASLSVVAPLAQTPTPAASATLVPTSAPTPSAGATATSEPATSTPPAAAPRATPGAATAMVITVNPLTAVVSTVTPAAPATATRVPPMANRPPSAQTPSPTNSVARDAAATLPAPTRAPPGASAPAATGTPQAPAGSGAVVTGAALTLPVTEGGNALAPTSTPPISLGGTAVAALNPAAGPGPVAARPDNPMNPAVSQGAPAGNATGNQAGLPAAPFESLGVGLLLVMVGIGGWRLFLRAR